MSAKPILEIDSPHTADATLFTAHLRAHAAEYFSGNAGGPVDVRLVSEDVRASSVLYWYIVRCGDEEKRIIVKVATPDRTGQPEPRQDPPPDRPRITACADPERRFILEYHALARIHRHFRLMNDPRFGTIRVFELLPDQQAVVMEVVDQPTLRQLAIREGTRQSAAGLAAVRKAFSHSGAWLRAFHTMPGVEPVDDLSTRRSDFIQYTEALTVYLASRGGDRSFLLDVNTVVALQARDELPDELPIAVSHGDYAARNILVGNDQRVTVLDSLARYRSPIYRDIGCFLTNLYFGGVYALSRGAVLHPARIPAYRELFLRGYFSDGPVPDSAIRLYEVQALLERWSSIMWRYSLVHGIKRAGLRLTQPLVSTFFRAAIRSTLARRNRVPAMQAAGSTGASAAADRPTSDADGQPITPARQKEIAR